MKVLIVKTSSLGDVLHTLPALTDARHCIPGITFDWVVEKPFAEIPLLHPSVKRVIPVAIRRWRKQLMTTLVSGELKNFLKDLRADSYDVVLDAQGLLKSAAIARCAKGPRYGLDWHSAWESSASLFYQKNFSVDPSLHAITRIRLLFSQALGYTIPDDKINYGIDRHQFVSLSTEKPYILFLHGTTWATKHWPENYWCELAKRVNEIGFAVKLPWGNDQEKIRAENIKNAATFADVLPKLNLTGIAKIIAGAKAVVAVDTGLGHLTAALDVPCISLYGVTDPAEIGTIGQHQQHLQSTFSCDPRCNDKRCVRAQTGGIFPACFAELGVEKVVLALKKIV
jgi:heptosyltransferase-1